MSQSHKVIIIGSGPSGYTAALYATRAELAPLVLAGEKSGGQLMNTTLVENWPGEVEGVQGPELMINMRAQAEKFGAQILDTFVTAVDFSSRPFKVWTGFPENAVVSELTGNPDEIRALISQVKLMEPTYEAETVIISTGAYAKMLDVPGEKQFFGRGVATCAVCDAPFYRSKKVFVVGGGDAAVEDTLALTRFADEVTMLVRKDHLRASKIMARRAQEHPKVKILWNTEIAEVTGDKVVQQIRVTNNQTGESQQFQADGVFYAIGHNPMSQIFAGEVELDEQGYVVTRLGYSQKGLELAQQHTVAGLVQYPTMTSKEGVFAAGDIVDFRYRQAVTAAAMGCQAALDVERFLHTSE